MPEEEAQQTAPKGRSKKKIFIFLIVGILIIFLSAGVVSVFISKSGGGGSEDKKKSQIY